MVRGVDGPDLTIIEGYQMPGTTNGADAVRCAFVGDGAVLTGFTLRNGATGSANDRGGGVRFTPAIHASGIVSNCVITGNAAGSGGGASGEATLIHCTLSNNWARLYGGGAYGCKTAGCLFSANTAGQWGGAAEEGMLTDCVLIGNSAGTAGGGTYGARLFGCTVVSNTALNASVGTSGGGVANSLMVANSIVYFNNARFENQANYDDSPMRNCCTTPAPTSGFGNITNAPGFVDISRGDYHLVPDSPCINSGRNSLAGSTQDFDGNPRVQGGTVDIGAYEFQSPASVLSYAWAQQYGVPINGSADNEDPDHDRFSNSQESIAGTDPTNADSALKIISAVRGTAGVTITWQSVIGRSYFIERASGLSTEYPFSILANSVAGKDGTTTYNDPAASEGIGFFYRVGIVP